jgi:uncharacterized membrane protein YidH (DUF202 family)
LALGDPGLQSERTALAWSRTAMAVLANALLAMRAGIVGQRWPITALGIALLVAAAAVMTFAALRRRQLSSGQGPSSSPLPMIQSTVVFALIACMTAVASATLDA